MKEVTQVLIDARAKIIDPAHWIQGSFACDMNLRKVDPESDRAACFCSVGAIRNVTSDEVLQSEAREHLRYVIIAMRGFNPWLHNIPDFNDSSTHEEVISVFDKAIKLSKGE